MEKTAGDVFATVAALFGNNYNVVDRLGKGFNSTTYVLEKNKKYYAGKVTNISKDEYDDLKEGGLRLSISRELVFQKELAAKHRDQFAVLYECDVIEDCGWHHVPHESTAEDDKEFWDKQCAGICLTRVYSIKEAAVGLLNTQKMSLKEKYSFTAQVAAICLLMQDRGYLYDDLHVGNICYEKTDKKTIKITGIEIAAFGRIYSIIDYDMLLHKKFDLNEEEAALLDKKPHSFLDLINRYFKYVPLLDGNFEYDYPALLKNIIDSPIAANKIIPFLQKGADNMNHIIVFNLFLLLREIDLYKMAGIIKPDARVKKTDLKTNKTKWYLPAADMKYIFENAFNLSAIAEYFAKKTI